jgi:hypothetical protein
MPIAARAAHVAKRKAHEGIRVAGFTVRSRSMTGSRLPCYAVGLLAA